MTSNRENSRADAVEKAARQMIGNVTAIAA
jgi:hypothetical protein